MLWGMSDTTIYPGPTCCCELFSAGAGYRVCGTGLDAMTMTGYHRVRVFRPNGQMDLLFLSKASTPFMLREGLSPVQSDPEHAPTWVSSR
jgi:hypothetical protein